MARTCPYVHFYRSPEKGNRITAWLRPIVFTPGARRAYFLYVVAGIQINFYKVREKWAWLMDR